MSISAIDFNALYRSHMAATGRRPMSMQAWNERAAGQWHKLARSEYVDGFISRMDLSGCDSLLDVGCGSGALCLPLASDIRQIVAMDYSSGMLDVLREQAHSQDIANIDIVLRSWEEAWDDIPECDIAIASRSTQVEDLASALAKLHAKARRRVYLTHRAGGHFVPPEALLALDRQPLSPPDYIYVLNILHSMGIHPRLDYLEADTPDIVTSAEDLIRRATWALDTLDPEETGRLQAWYDRQTRHGPVVMPARRWAFISWDK